MNQEQTAIRTNEYSGEHQTRKQVSHAAEDNRLAVDTYGLADKAGKRTLKVGLSGFGGEDRPLWLKAIALALDEHPDNV